MLGNRSLGWVISLRPSEVDSIIFEAKRDVRIHGVGVYGEFDHNKHDFTIKYRWIIQKSPNGDTVEESQ